jgi:hypothetical protein
MSILRSHRSPAAVARFGLAPLHDSLWGALLLNSTIEIRAAARLPQPNFTTESNFTLAKMLSLSPVGYRLQ